MQHALRAICSVPHASVFEIWPGHSPSQTSNCHRVTVVCEMQLITRSVHDAPCNMQPARRNMQGATCKQHAKCNTQHATCMQNTTCNMLHIVCCMLHTSCCTIDSGGGVGGVIFFTDSSIFIVSLRCKNSVEFNSVVSEFVTAYSTLVTERKNCYRNLIRPITATNTVVKKICLQCNTPACIVRNVLTTCV